ELGVQSAQPAPAATPTAAPVTPTAPPPTAAVKAPVRSGAAEGSAGAPSATAAAQAGPPSRIERPSVSATEIPTATLPPTSTPIPTRTGEQVAASETEEAAAPASDATPAGFQEAQVDPARFAPRQDGPQALQTFQNDTTLWLGVPFRSQIDATAFAQVNC